MRLGLVQFGQTCSRSLDLLLHGLAAALVLGQVHAGCAVGVGVEQAGELRVRALSDLASRSARLAAGRSGAQPGARVDVYFRAAGTRQYVDRRDLLATRSGAWSTTYVANTDYAVFATAAARRSPVSIVRAAFATISGPARVARGATVVLRGTARPRTRVTVYFRRAGTTRYVARRATTASATGTFRTSYRAYRTYAYFATADGVHSTARVTRVVARPVTRPAAPRPPAPRTPTRPARPADRDCSDFSNQAQAQAFYNRYFPYYGDFARLDGNDNDRRACESLP